MVGIETPSPMSLMPRMHREIQARADRSDLLSATIKLELAEAASIDGLPITSATHEEVLLEIDRKIAAREMGKYISITNTESMYHGLRIAAHGEYIRKANISLCDGVGVIVAGWAWGHRIKRFNGPVLQLECSKYGVSKKWRHFFYGGKEGVTEEMTRRLMKRFPGLIVCGTHEPPFYELSIEEKAAVIDKINNSKPDIVWVGLGLLKQERWIAEHLGRIQAPWMIGVGAAFDYHSGNVPWAPAIVRAAGLEWAFRLIIQPRLRAKRYWWSAVYVAQATFKGLVTGQFLNRPRYPVQT
jgi:N-acetylglucosaminyldiphosphoundecaprenol N-acetyl-beta-D-mannosaminyltransferase